MAAPTRSRRNLPRFADRVCACEPASVARGTLEQAEQSPSPPPEPEPERREPGPPSAAWGSAMSRPGSARNKSIPGDKINLRLIMVSGKSREFLFGTHDSAGDIAQFVFDTWPEDWSEEAVAKAEVLRLIYQGRFLHNNVTLGALGLPLGKTTVMHLVPRENLPEPNSQDQRQKSKAGSSRCCSVSCAIL